MVGFKNAVLLPLKTVVLLFRWFGVVLLCEAVVGIQLELFLCCSLKLLLLSG
jgi:hypothetical protein